MSKIKAACDKAHLEGVLDSILSIGSANPNKPSRFVLSESDYMALRNSGALDQVSIYYEEICADTDSEKLIAIYIRSIFGNNEDEEVLEKIND